ncbi:replicative DNA helicase [Ornithinibacillus sp. JPR2-1]|uniref:replicative DNA helicase n=1 Tax=Ornithinibacillus sp. JPR2-1 TaxID=2094019 RepID=UPI0031D66919
MELTSLAEITSGYRERSRRLALFDPLYELDRKKMKDLIDRPIDMKGLGLLTLLFFFEQKIIRNPKVGTKDLANFIKQLTKNTYKLDEKAYAEIAFIIIQTFRPTTGKKRAYPFYNWETKKNDQLEYAILKANAFDSKTNTQYYTLDEDGLELIFATKEFYSEFQLSINQLMLRKQLEKGEFKGALRQINEMHIDVESLNERLKKLRHEIQRSIVSEETFERYKQLLEDIYARLERENEEFLELRQFVNETKERLYEKDYHQKEKKTYGYVLEITVQLEEVHYEHSRLLEQSIELKNHTLKAAQESLYYTGIDAFNFDQDINAKLISTPLPLEAMKGLLHPFLRIHHVESWSPLTIFAEQNIREDRENHADYSFMDVDDDEQNDYQERIRNNYAFTMKITLEALENKCSQLKEIIDYVRNEDKETLLHQRFFYDFWILLHQRSPIVSGVIEQAEDEQFNSLDLALALLGNRTLKIQERKERLNVTERFAIQNMDVIVMGDEADEL